MRRDILQGEGCEQGDTLAQALFALGQHDALCQAAAKLRPEYSLVVFLGNLYVSTNPASARAASDESACFGGCFGTERFPWNTVACGSYSGSAVTRADATRSCRFRVLCKHQKSKL